MNSEEARIYGNEIREAALAAIDKRIAELNGGYPEAIDNLVRFELSRIKTCILIDAGKCICRKIVELDAETDAGDENESI